MFIQKRRIVAEDEFDDVQTTPDAGADTIDDEGSVSIDPEATDLLFETDDVAQVIAEVTGEDVDVTVDDESGEVEFGVGDNVFTVTPEEDTEVLESRRIPRAKRSVRANTSRASKRRTRTVKASSSVVRRASGSTRRVAGRRK